MPLLIPITPGDSHFDLSVELEGITYMLEFYWSARDESWFMDVKTAEAEPIYTGLRIVLNFPLLLRCVDERRPPGEFIAIDTAGTQVGPGLADLGARVQLTYQLSTE